MVFGLKKDVNISTFKQILKVFTRIAAPGLIQTGNVLENQETGIQQLKSTDNNSNYTPH